MFVTFKFPTGGFAVEWYPLSSGAILKRDIQEHITYCAKYDSSNRKQLESKYVKVEND